MDKYNVTGMSCSACSARVEKAVSKVDGVSTCQVNLLTNSMMVDGTASRDDIISAVEKAGMALLQQMAERRRKAATRLRAVDSRRAMRLCQR